jgi:hypothetical protein
MGHVTIESPEIEWVGGNHLRETSMIKGPYSEIMPAISRIQKIDIVLKSTADRAIHHVT